MCWESFAATISARRLQPKPYLIDQVKHLLSIVDKNFSGFVVTDDSQESAPTSGLQKAFIEVFMLKQYLPTIMHICMPNDDIIKPTYVYYSLNFPTVLEGSPTKRNTSTIAKDLRDIKLSLETLKANLKNNIWHKPNKITRDAELNYFHYVRDPYHQIQSSENIILEDKSFLRDKTIYPTRSFCATSSFFSGCIRITTSFAASQGERRRVVCGS
ncbi:MAG: hypothetical protein LBL17_00990 [Coxiellaceae bacterium]|jgi:hypothetical protein|nr:hypothetical protein [Coxiellaceae bacterium]